MSTSPRALVVCLRSDWHSAARLPGWLAARGFTVGVICPAGALITYARPVGPLLTFVPTGHFAGFASALAEVLRAQAPDLVLPGDDDARLALHDLYVHLDPAGDAALRILLEHSLGDPGHHAQVERKSALLALADSGFPAPAGGVVGDLDSALALAEALGYPVMLKRDFGAGGTGVSRCDDMGQLRAAYAQVSARPSPRAGRLVLQRWVDGATTSTNFAAWRGELLAAVTSLRESVHPEPHGMVTVARLLPDQAALELTRRVVAHLGLSGLGSLQCLQDPQGAPLIMELNARVTLLSGASLAFGVDLIGALRSAVCGEALPAPANVTYARVATFPNAWLRDPGDPLLNRPDVFHDVPWSQPELLAATIRQVRPPG